MIQTFDLGQNVQISWKSGGESQTFTINNAELLINSDFVQYNPENDLIIPDSGGCQRGFCWTPAIAIRDKYHTNFFLSLSAANVYLKQNAIEIDGDVCYVVWPFINNCGAVAGFQIPYGNTSKRSIRNFVQRSQAQIVVRLNNAEQMVGAMKRYKSA